MKKQYISLLILLLPCLLHAQGLHISSGASMVVQGNASIVLNDASFINDGKFHADNSSIIFSGDNSAFVGGISRTAFNNLVLQNQLQLESDISINGQLTMSSGNLELNNRRLDLGSTGIIIGENINSRITGEHGGIVTATAVLNAPRNVNPGNIGVEINSSSNGTFVITRGHVQQINNAGERSIQRYYDVSPSLNDLTLKVGYLDAELAGNRKSDLVLWKLNNRFTMGVGSTALSAYPNPARDRFTMSYYSLSNRRTVITLKDVKGHTLETKQVQLIPGLNTIQWNISGYASGTYFLVLENSNVKLVKQ